MYLFLCIVSFISVFPLYWMICAATNKSAEVVSGRLIPGTYFIQNFKNLLGNQNIGRALGNSFKYAIPAFYGRITTIRLRHHKVKLEF